ncbi:hypothetical protein BLNAU_8739 [Blattamonas nauphoetae]|uniref:Uncharacterized protein n=1 Tax=Blattamonas nauphoetae TaxID=2049346 RepID=A0ABQ9XXE6_9EUKA|nr:hypothetical protein BLNAU_8739 [Blattamonas nauphoetae]
MDQSWKAIISAVQSRNHDIAYNASKTRLSSIICGISSTSGYSLELKRDHHDRQVNRRQFPPKPRQCRILMNTQHINDKDITESFSNITSFWVPTTETDQNTTPRPHTEPRASLESPPDHHTTTHQELKAPTVPPSSLITQRSDSRRRGTYNSSSGHSPHSCSSPSPTTA